MYVCIYARARICIPIELILAKFLILVYLSRKQKVPLSGETHFYVRIERKFGHRI